MLTSPLTVVLTLMLSIGAKPEQVQDTTSWFRLDMHIYNDGVRFGLKEEAYVAIFRVGLGNATLIYPAIGDELRKLRFGESKALPKPTNLYRPGRHRIPDRAGRVWSASTENGGLMKGQHLLVIASRKPFRFEQLNSLYVGDGKTLARHNSLGVVD